MSTRRPGRGLRSLAIASLVCLVCGCKTGLRGQAADTPATDDRERDRSYLTDRLWDLTDILDVKYGTSLGLGAKLEATRLLGIGQGGATHGYFREWFGRRSNESRDDDQPLRWHGDGVFAYVAWVGVDRRERTEWLRGSGSLHLAGFNFGLLTEAFMSMEAPDRSTYPEDLDFFRFGGEVVLPGALAGVYLNVGQLIDFLLGWGTLDIADDDGVSKLAHD